MTIIAAMIESDESILIGADSGETNADTRLRSLNHAKLQAHDRLPLAWGICGNATLGIDGFSKQLKAREPINDWHSLKIVCEDTMAALVARERDLGQKSGYVFNPMSEGAEVLLVGVLEGTARILGIDWYGKGSYGTRRYHAIGQNSQFLEVLYKFVVKRGEPNAEDFHDMLDAAARSFQMCDPPVHVWRVTPDGVFDTHIDRPKKASKKSK